MYQPHGDRINAIDTTGEKIMSYNSLREKIAAEKQERAERHAGYKALYELAMREGYRAGELATPRTMYVQDTATGQVWAESEGMCGFAWVVVKNANKGFGHWLIKTGLARKGYQGGAHIWISAHNQSIERKTEHAIAVAQVLRNAGVDAYADSRLD